MPINRVILESRGTENLYTIHGQSSGATITADLRSGTDFERQGPRAMELIAMGLAACMAAVTTSLMAKRRLPFESIRIEVDGDRNEASPTEFRSVAIRVHLRGATAGQEELQKVIDLAAKHCPAHHTLSHGVPITAAVVPA